MTEKIGLNNGFTVVIRFTYFDWAKINISSHHILSGRHRKQIMRAVDRYNLDYYSYIYAARVSAVRPILTEFTDAAKRMRTITGDILGMKFSDEIIDEYSYDLEEAQADGFYADRYFLHLLNERFPRKRKFEEIAYEATRQEIERAQRRIFQAETYLGDVYQVLQWLQVSSASALDDLPEDLGREGDPYLNELLERLFKIFMNACRHKLNANCSYDFIFMVCKKLEEKLRASYPNDILASNDTIRKTSRGFVSAPLHSLTKSGIKERLKKNNSSKNGKNFKMTAT